MADETPTKVLDKDNDKDIHQGYYWVYRDVEKKLIVFDYQDTRGSSAPVNMLKNSKGFLQTDGYGVYDKYDKQDGLTLIHCMAHARRYFEKALDNDKARSEYVLQKIQYSMLLNEELVNKTIILLNDYKKGKTIVYQYSKNYTNG